MATVYKTTILGISQASSGTTHVDATISYRVSGSPVTWSAPVWHGTIVLTWAELQPINDDAGLTNIQKRNAIRDIVKTKALAMGIDTSDMAYATMSSLFAGILPDDITIRQ
jgi:hypothetical protein